MQPKIIGGWPVSINDAPYHAAVVHWEPSEFKNLIGEWKYRCGGSIINEWWILTAAQCIVDTSEEDPDPDQITALRSDQVAVAIARDDNNYSKQWLEHIIRKVTSIIPHPKFEYIDLSNSINDIGLLGLLQTPLVWNNRVMPVVLPTSATPLPVVSSQACLTGFGMSKQNVSLKRLGRERERLNAVCGPIEDHEKCNTKKPPYFCSDGSRICLSDRRPLPSRGCLGDSGGGLTKKFPNGSFLLVGVFFGLEVQCTGKAMESFMNVAHYLSWIKDIVKDIPKLG